MRPRLPVVDANLLSEVKPPVLQAIVRGAFQHVG
jgi:hypothetical protein